MLRQSSSAPSLMVIFPSSRQRATQSLFVSFLLGHGEDHPFILQRVAFSQKDFGVTLSQNNHSPMTDLLTKDLGVGTMPNVRLF